MSGYMGAGVGADLGGVGLCSEILTVKGLGSNALWHLHGVFTTAQQ